MSGSSVTPAFWLMAAAAASLIASLALYRRAAR